MNLYFIGGAAIAAFLAGWTVNDWRHDAAVKSAMDKVRQEEQVKLDALRVSLDDANSKRLELAADLAAEKANVKIKYRTITQEVPTYVPSNTEQCNYDLDPRLVGLLISAATGVLGYTGSPSNAAGYVSGALSGQPTDLAGEPSGGPN